MLIPDPFEFLQKVKKNLENEMYPGILVKTSLYKMVELSRWFECNEEGMWIVKDDWEVVLVICK